MPDCLSIKKLGGLVGFSGLWILDLGLEFGIGLGLDKNKPWNYHRDKYREEMMKLS